MKSTEFSELFEGLHEKECKKMEQLVDEDIQLVACNGQDSILIMDGKNIIQYNTFIGYSSKEGRLCVGKYNKSNISLSEESGLLRVFIDCRKTEDVKLHVTINGQYSKLSNSEKSNDSLLVVYIEGQSFAQLSLFDGHLLNEKVSHTLVTNPKMKSRIRSIAYSILNQNFNEFMERLSIVGEDNHENEKEE